MPQFRQIIRPGQSGRDVHAVKLAYRRIGVPGAGALAMTNRAGPAFVHVTKTFQRHHGLHADGIYGRATHNKLVAARRAGKPAFGEYASRLYRSARLRKPAPPPIPNLDAQHAAKKLLEYHNQGKYRADNSGDLRDLQATAAGRAVWSQGGYWIHIDRRPLDVLIWLIENGHKVGTFAICSDHHYDGPHGHAGGLAVDISWFDGAEIGSYGSRAEALKVAQLIHNAPGMLKPWQLICDGYGYQHDPSISALTIPGAWFYGPSTMAGHRNHLHAGYL